MSLQIIQRHCTYHADAPAIAICTECAGDVCAACHGADLRGYCICAACREKFAPPRHAWETRRNHYSPAAFVQTLGEALKSPSRFFLKVPPIGSHWPAVLFGSICMGAGFLFSNAWKLLYFETFSEELTKMADEMGVGLDMLKTAMLLSVPLRVGLAFLLHTAVLSIALRIAGARLRLSLLARIVGYSSAGYIFMIIPPIGEFMLGHFLAIIWMFNLEMGAITLLARISLWKTVIVIMATLMLVLPLAF